MKTTFLKMIYTAVLISALPAVSHAYEVTEAHAVRLNNDYALFTISYEYGFLNREALLPIIANQGTTTLRSDAEYVLRDKDGLVITGEVAAALVVSADAEVQNGHYHIPQGRNRNFTLMAIIKTPANSSISSLAVTQLPFYLVEGTKATLSSAPTTEIPNYVTPALK